MKMKKNEEKKQHEINARISHGQIQQQISVALLLWMVELFFFLSLFLRIVVEFYQPKKRKINTQTPQSVDHWLNNIYTCIIFWEFALTSLCTKSFSYCQRQFFFSLSFCKFILLRCELILLSIATNKKGRRRIKYSVILSSLFCNKKILISHKHITYVAHAIQLFASGVWFSNDEKREWVEREKKWDISRRLEQRLYWKGQIIPLGNLESVSLLLLFSTTGWKRIVFHRRAILYFSFSFTCDQLKMTINLSWFVHVRQITTKTHQWMSGLCGVILSSFVSA